MVNYRRGLNSPSFYSNNILKMIHYNPKDPSYHPIDLDFNMKMYNEIVAELDYRPKNPPQKRLSKKQFYELLERFPYILIPDSDDEKVTMNNTELIWFSQCKKPIPLKEVMKLREKYFPNLYPKEPITRKLPSQGSTARTYFLPGKLKNNSLWIRKKM